MKNARGMRLTFAISIVLTSIYLLWRVFFTLPLDRSWPEIIFGVALIVSEISANIGTFELMISKGKHFELELPEIPLDWYPEVDIFIATHNEEVELLYKTVNACTYMDYPDRSKVHIYLCDDTQREAVQELARQLNVGYLGVKDNKHAKSGNLNYALENTNSEYVITFDADMIPRRSFLMKSMPYFFLPRLEKKEDHWVVREERELDVEETIALIQTPQNFYNPDLFQFNLYAEEHLPNEQDFFSREINQMHNSTNSITYTGSNTIILRKALVEAGGFPLETITEDYELGMRIQGLGYRTYATDEVLASGLAPTTIESMANQRRRWARGIIQSCRNMKIPFNKHLNLAQNFTYLMSLLYWWSFLRRIIFTLAPILFAGFDFQVANVQFWELAVFWAPSHLFYSLSMRYLSSNIRTQRWNQIVDTTLAPFLIFPVIKESLGFKETSFKVTSKEKKQSRNKDIKYLWPHLLLLVLSVYSLIRFNIGKYGMALFYSTFINFWLLYNIINFVYAIFFVMGRESKRAYERFRADIDITFEDKGELVETVSYDISEGGISFVMDKPHYIENRHHIEFRLKSEPYYATAQGELLHVRRYQKQWLYSVRFTHIEEQDKREFLQIIYDRQNHLPSKLDVWMTPLDDILNNIRKRLYKAPANQRTLPRVKMMIPIHTDIFSAMMVDFNYQYARLKEMKIYQQPEDGQFHFELEGLEVVLEFVNQENAESETPLMRIVNWRDLVNNQKLIEHLSRWSNEA